MAEEVEAWRLALARVEGKLDAIIASSRDAVEQVKVDLPVSLVGEEVKAAIAEARAIKEAPVEETVIAEELTQTPDQV